MAKIFLYTENFFLFPKFKSSVKFLLGQDTRGPKAVLESLCKGLTEAGVEYEVNLKFKKAEHVCVLSGVSTLRWAIKQKKIGKVKSIVAGPNLVISTKDEKEILLDPAIDAIIVPSQWVYDFYSKESPQITSKLRIWPAGVTIPASKPSQKYIDFLVYNKLGNENLSDQIVSELQKKNYKVRVFNYGKFEQQEYFKALEASRFEIYLSRSESQGLAMFEAWARGVPTLAWEKGLWELNGIKVTGKISAPYLNSECGDSFLDFNDFLKVLPKFFSTGYDPKSYVERLFSNKVCAEKYLKILSYD
jgi:hypothetical protein